MASSFQAVLAADGTSLKGMLVSPKGEDATVEGIARRLRLNKAELVCAVGFNHEARGLNKGLAVLGYTDFDALASHRDLIFVTDVYQRLSLRDVLAVYAALAPEARAGLHDLIFDRLSHIEGEMDTKIDGMVVESYKREVSTLYLEGIVGRAFADRRLGTGNPGFRALANELKLMLEAGLYSAAEVLGSDALRPEEKRRIVERGCVTEADVREHLEHAEVPEREREMLAALIE
jgi:hypothetical protein